MTVSRDRFSRTGGGNEAAALQAVAAKRRRVWFIVIVANAIALVGAIAGCLFMLRTQGVQTEVARMRDEVGETLTMMSLGGPSEAVAKFLPGLIDMTGRWDRKFSERREDFRKLDEEIGQVQEMHRLGATAERWRKELEGVSPMQRNEYWQKSIKAQIEAEQKKWPNLMHKKGTTEWLQDVWKEVWFGMRHALVWPCGIYARTVEIGRGGGAIDQLTIGERLRYILFPYSLSAFTMLRLAGIAFVTSAIGYLMCWIGLKSGLGWLSYMGLIYFLYLLMVAAFIVCLEVMA